MNEIEELKEMFKDNIKFNEPMRNHTTFKIGGQAKIFIQAKTEEEVKKVLEKSKKVKKNVFIIGNGSNILVHDEGINGIVLKICIKEIEIEENQDVDVTVKVGAGVKNAELAQKLLKKGIKGFEFASGVPGTIGGAIYMNAGAYGEEFKNIVQNVTYMDKEGKMHTIKNEDCKFGYRNSIFTSGNFIILSAVLKLERGNIVEIEKRMKELANLRKEKQPIEYPSAGSTFKRGDGFITAKLIDDCGLKGYKIGGAQIFYRKCWKCNCKRCIRFSKIYSK